MGNTLAPQAHEDFGPNQGFIEDLYVAFLADPSQVPPQWGELFRRWRTQGRSPVEERQSSVPTDPQTVRAQAEVHAQSDSRQTDLAAMSTRSDLPPAPLAASQPARTPYAKSYSIAASEGSLASGATTRLKGTARSVAANMDASLAIPTATSFRQIPVKTMFDNRMLINEHLQVSRGGKISFTHLIAYAVVEALVQMPDMNSSYELADGKPAIHQPEHVNFGLAIDARRPDGSRTLVVPSIKAAELMTFREFVNAYEDLVLRGREGSLGVEDFQGTTVSLTNPGGIGTTQSVPRLMSGQGLIVGVGSMVYPAEFAGTSDKALSRMGVSRVLTLTSTYDHRIIQGAASGEFLRLVETKLLGKDGFYERVFLSMHVPAEPYTWERDVEYTKSGELDKPARVARLIHSYRSRGHLIADLDPIAFRPLRHPDLALSSYGLTAWDLDRHYPTGDFMPGNDMTLREVLSQLRWTYCSTVGYEYMHVTDPAQRRWFHDRLERPRAVLTDEERFQILEKLNEAEAFETFLHTKYVGQKRFSLEGGESLIPALDAILSGAARDGMDSVAISMSHRGRLNVLTNIAGKSYKQIFTEFDGLIDPRSYQGSGDVKYHLGTEGTYTSPTGQTTGVYLAANPSHLEAAGGVLEGIVRARQDQLAEIDDDVDAHEDTVLPILIHGDAAFAGQGVVPEVLNLSQLAGYRTGGTVHIIVNNQIGFTTTPNAGRSSNYATDIAKGLQLPIFHVNGDDPEAVVRAAALAYEYRQAFHKDVIVDIICYRRRGHNEGDDPSMTQPVMYSRVDSKRTTRQLYKEALLGRGEITADQAEAFEVNYQANLNHAFAEVKEAEAAARSGDEDAIAGLELPAAQQPDAGTMIGWTSATSAAIVARIGEAHLQVPDGFTLHPKIAQLFERRAKMAREGDIDWGMGELLAFGSLLIDGLPVRMSGQDVRRGTFVQRHATAHDLLTGAEWTPLDSLTHDQAKLWIYDSPLSEYAVMAFEYGYSVERPDALVIWEAQFGDFANGAQTVVDEFVSSASQKWTQNSSLVLMLPHGYEGQGPDHSSGRIERYLQLCAQENMWVCQPSTPANHFHMLRTQAYDRPRRPLVAFTPKQLLRRRGAVSAVEEFTSGGFRPVIGDDFADRAGVDRVLLCSGRIYYDLIEERAKRGDATTAIVRLEQFYPLASSELGQALAAYPGAEIVWVQDEPENMGPWRFLATTLFRALKIDVRLVSRPESASPSAGLTRQHVAENARLMEQAFAR
ncbi:MAG: multifunctional oxoglutarate decarboxylase/oxoglutarate dehydrogenase thiamine pyrophosphate-binding subunit/dihydrolipoyllysine-residue succinyltransferase subunit [Actinomycetaceae bacterium]|nr:multifunctional oxoglutarate decarboxylase/oxoglutarate dehydrogenase thiamine pyrophosphate-binding subunit/dihydrolipoyllysine-residue succinyltransferase subunit [Actinomycetaceae bacterium]